MLSKTNEVFKKVYLRLTQTKRIERRIVNNYSYTVINSHLSLNSFIPISRFAISPTGILHLLNYCILNEPKVIVEFGNGVSTLYLAKLIQKCDLACSFYSVDHDMEWMNKVAGWLQTEGVDSKVHLIHAGLTNDLSFKNAPIKWYDVNVLNERIPKEKVDFLIIDGPPGNFVNARAGALLYFSEQIENGQLNYFFDDAKRKRERKIIELLGRNNEYAADYAFGGNLTQKFNSMPITLYK